MKLAIFGWFLTLPTLILLTQTLLARPPAFFLSIVAFAAFLGIVAWGTRISSSRHRIEFDLSRALTPFGIFLWGEAAAPAVLLYYVGTIVILRRWKVLAPASGAAFLSSYLAGLAYQGMGAPLAAGSLTFHTLAAMILAFLVFEAVNLLGVAFYLFLKEGTLGQNIRDNTLVHSVPNLLFFPVNILLLLIWTNWTPWHLALAVLPLIAAAWVLRLAFRSSREKEELSILYDLGETVETCLAREEILRTLADASSDSHITPDLMVARLNRGRTHLTPVEVKGLFEESREREIPIQDAFWREVLYEGRSLRIGSLRDDHPMRLQVPNRVQSLLIVPLICGLEAEGALLAGHESPDFFHEDHERLLSVMAGQVSSSLARVDLYDRLVTTNRELQEASSRFQKELELARKVQIGLLPQKMQGIQGCELAFETIPAGEVGGDYYDFATLSPEQICVAIGDVSGKGLPAALLMAITKSLFHTEVSQSPSPAVILERMNRRLCEIVKSDHYVAFSVGILDLGKRELLFANAGQTFPLRGSQDGMDAEFVEIGGMPLGIQEEARYEDRRLPLPTNSFLLFYTDGVVEAMNQEGDFFGFERLREFAHPGRFQGADPFVRELSKAISDFRGDAEQNDDLTMVAVRIP